MATSYMTSADLIESVKRRASIPEDQVTFKENDFLDLANEETAIGLVPSILQVHEEYFVYSEDVPCVAGQVAYPIPYRAIGNKLRQLSWVDVSGNKFPMARINPEDEYNNINTYLGSPRGFKIEAGNIVLIAAPNSVFTGNLRFDYFLRPNCLVDLDRGGQILSINRTTGVITLTDDVPEHFSLSLLYDFNRTKPDHRIISFDNTATTIGINSLTFDPDNIPDSLEAGDYICQAGETVIPNVPTDLHVVLAHRVAARCLEALGDTQGLKNANSKLAEMEGKTNNLIDNRSDGNPQKVINRTNMLRQGFRNRYRGRW